MRNKRRKIKPITIGEYIFKNQPHVLFEMFPKKTGKEILRWINWKVKLKEMK